MPDRIVKTVISLILWFAIEKRVNKLSESTDMVNLVRAVEALKQIEWFKKSVRDIRAFRVENWSDFTGFVKDL
ncbi:hypothetical protein AGMMS50239_08300 [Bacteroidia bacterium]|nr:hypothetical protein AGMMS50239_08300 [Bacteroidia bacterium]